MFFVQQKSPCGFGRREMMIMGNYFFLEAL